MTGPPQPRSSLPLRVAPAFCFIRGTTKAAAAMLTTEPGGGAHSRRAECGCASSAEPKAPQADKDPASQRLHPLKYLSQYRESPPELAAGGALHRSGGAHRPPGLQAFS